MLEPLIAKARWAPVRFDQIAMQINDRVDNPAESGVERYVGLEHLDPDSLRIRRWGEPTDVEAAKLRFQPGDIIFGKRRVYQRKVAVADFEGICSAHAMVLRAKPDAVLQEFLPFFMQSDLFMERALTISVGSLSPTINWKTLAAEEFRLPPIQQQARLAEVCRAISTLRISLIDLDFSANQLIEALSGALFSGVLDKLDPRRKTIGQIFDHIVDCGYSDLPILSVTIDGFVVRREEIERHVSDDTGNEKYKRVKPGDLAYNTMRLWQGAIGIAQEEGLISPAYTVIRAKHANVDADFFLELFRSLVMQREYRKLVTGVASDRWRLYFNDLAKLALTLPTSQQDIEAWSGLKKLKQERQLIKNRLIAVDQTLKQIHREFFST